MKTTEIKVCAFLLSLHFLFTRNFIIPSCILIVSSNHIFIFPISVLILPTASSSFPLEMRSNKKIDVNSDTISICHEQRGIFRPHHRFSAKFHFSTSAQWFKMGWNQNMEYLVICTLVLSLFGQCPFLNLHTVARDWMD